MSVPENSEKPTALITGATAAALAEADYRDIVTDILEGYRRRR